SSSQTSRSSSARWRIARAASRVPSKSSSSVSDSRRLPTNLSFILTRLCCSRASCSLTCARSLKCIDATCITPPQHSSHKEPQRRRGNQLCFALRLCVSLWILTFARQHLRDMQHLRLCIPAPPPPALDVQHAPEVAEHHGVGAGVFDMLAFVVGEPRGDLAEL